LKLPPGSFVKQRVFERAHQLAERDLSQHSEVVNLYIYECRYYEKHHAVLSGIFLRVAILILLGYLPAAGM